MKIANKNASSYVLNESIFSGSNLRGEYHRGIYVVWSYGWYPIFVKCPKTGAWYENENRYSMSTSKQMSQCRPDGAIKVSLEFLKQMLGLV